MAALPTAREAWHRALYGPGGRFTGPERDFTTALTDPVCGAPFAAALARLAHRVDAALDLPAGFTVVDVGAGTGAFLSWLAADPATPERWRLVGVEVAPRPSQLHPRVSWVGQVPATAAGFLLAHEWLDNVPCEVLRDGRVLMPDSSLGPQPGSADIAWLDRWWPGWRSGEAESGLARDIAWADAVGRLGRGLALAVDYGHTRGCRRPSLTGYRRGRQVPAAFDGSGDITAHVALDAVAAAVPGAQLSEQRAWLRALGVDGRLPVPLTAGGLQRANAAATLLAADGFGGFGWVSVTRGVSPAALGGPEPGTPGGSGARMAP